VRGLFTLTFEVNGTDEDEIRAAGLDLRQNFDRAAEKRTPGFKRGLFMCAIDGRAEPPSPADTDDPERLFDD
jgi:hypothetical protein